MHNNLRFYTLRITDTPELAEAMAQKFEDKFDSLDKYDMMELDHIINMDGFEEAFIAIENY